jgi:two-component system, sensor histidine kinase and response regulator
VKLLPFDKCVTFLEEYMSFDLNAALERVGGDQELLKEIAQLFLDDAPGGLALIREAVEKNDALALQRAAHSLKGSVANFGAEETVEAAYQLEQMGANGKLDGAKDVFVVLEKELRKVSEDLSQIE